MGGGNVVGIRRDQQAVPDADPRPKTPRPRPRKHLVCRCVGRYVAPRSPLAQGRFNNGTQMTEPKSAPADRVLLDGRLAGYGDGSSHSHSGSRDDGAAVMGAAIGRLRTGPKETVSSMAAGCF